MSETANSSLMDRADLFALLRRACREAGSARAWADAHGMSAGYLSQVQNTHREPGPKMLAALGLVEVTAYRKVSTHAA